MKLLSSLARFATILSVTMIVAGCATGRQVVSRDLPPETIVVLDPVPVPPLYGSARVVLARTGNALEEANSRLVKSRQIYRGVRKAYKGD